jgi:hypothetical protein
MYFEFISLFSSCTFGINQMTKEVTRKYLEMKENILK